MFPLTDLSKRLVYLPLKDEAWMLTPNSWWRFLINWPAVPVPPLISPRSLAPRSSRHPSEKLLSKVEVEWTHPIIILRKILQDRPVEYMMIGNLHWVKLLQFAEPEMSVTILIKATQEMMGIIKHSATLFREKIESRKALVEVWRLRDIEDSSSLSHFDFATNPYPIMNILIWNCRGALKP